MLSVLTQAADIYYKNLCLGSGRSFYFITISGVFPQERPCSILARFPHPVSGECFLKEHWTIPSIKCILIGHGDRDISSGVDVFWLPEAGRKTLLISPEEPARVIYRLVAGKSPFSENAKATLKNIMAIKKTDRGVLYWKNWVESVNLGWFEGYVESNSRTYAFACAVKGDKLTGRDARITVENILGQNGYL